MVSVAPARQNNGRQRWRSEDERRIIGIVVSSLSEVSEQITIAEHIPTEHVSAAAAVFYTGDEASSENVAGHPQCEVQVVKISNGNVSSSFATPVATASHIAASQSTL